MRIVQTIQVWQADPSEVTIPPRELTAVDPLLRSTDPGECLLSTNDLEREEKLEGKGIRCESSVLFLLGM
jgi:hypothetical protein